jgi:hypothetical protein
VIYKSDAQKRRCENQAKKVTAWSRLDRAKMTREVGLTASQPKEKQLAVR